MIDDNFNKGPRAFFDAVPMPMRPLIAIMIRKNVRRTLWGQGFGRQSREDMLRLAVKDIDGVADFLGDKQWLMANEPSSADAAVWASLASASAPYFETPLREAIGRHANLVAYRERGLKRWFPDFGEKG